MSGQEDDSDKSFEATQQKLLDARKKGDVPKSVDLFTAAAYAGLFATLTLLGAEALKSAAGTLAYLLDRPAELAQMIDNGGAAPVMEAMARQISINLSPIFLIPAMAVLLAIFAQQALVFAPDKIKPKLSRVSVVSNAKNKFGRSGLFEFFKSFVKLCIYSLCVALFIRAELPKIIGSMQTNPQMIFSLLARTALSFLFMAVLISACIGFLDALWQKMEHLRKNRMSRKEVQDETKNSEGDPHLKQERRQRAMAIAQNQMLADVPTADVIIVNPTHYAVALKWSRSAGEAPVCVAKGVDEIAKSIREVAMTSGVPIHSDPPTARSLFATTDIGKEIDAEHYRAVAAAIRFAEMMRKKAKSKV